MNITLKSLLADKKFRFLFIGIILVAIFEVLSLSGVELPRIVAFPLFLTIIIGIGYKTILGGFRALLRLDFKSISLLMVIAVVGAFIIGEYVEAAIVIVLFTVGEYLEDVGIEASRSALRRLTEMIPKTVKVKGKENEELIESIRVGEIIILQPSDLVPLDGIVVTGQSSVDESTITGEPIPRDKNIGDALFAGSLNLHGYLEVQVTKSAKDSTLAKIIELTFNAGKTKAQTQKFIESFSRFYTPAILVITILLVAVPTLIFNQPFEKWFEEALTLLVIACPCALVISTPVSIYAAIGNAAGKGVVIKGGKYLEEVGKIKAIALDKTRTLTLGKPVVSDVIPYQEMTRDHLLACAAGIEQYSEHPLASSILEAAQSENVTPHAVENFRSVFGKGATGECLICNDREHAIGKFKWITEGMEVQQTILDSVELLQKQGKTVMIVKGGNHIEGIIAVTDAIKEESAAVIKALHGLGVEIIMLTGDNKTPATYVASKLQITDVRADLLPDGKVVEMQSLLKQYGSVAMVGDGVNDAPALAQSSVGIVMGAAGSDAAIEAANIAILNDKLSVIPFLIQLGKKTLSTIRFNTIFAVGIKVLFIFLALFGISNLALAIFADVGVTLIVILVSLRLMKYSATVFCIFLLPYMFTVL